MRRRVRGHKLKGAGRGLRRGAVRRGSRRSRRSSRALQLRGGGKEGEGDLTLGPGVSGAESGPVQRGSGVRGRPGAEGVAEQARAACWAGSGEKKRAGW